MIARFSLSLALAVLAMCLPSLGVSGETWGNLPAVWTSLPLYGGLYAPPAALLALLATRRWKGDRLLFRRRRLDERENSLLASVDRAAIGVFIAVASVAALIFLALWVGQPSVASDRLAAIAPVSHGFAIVAQVSIIARSAVTFVAIHSVIGLLKFAREARV